MKRIAFHREYVTLTPQEASTSPLPVFLIYLQSGQAAPVCIIVHLLVVRRASSVTTLKAQARAWVFHLTKLLTTTVQTVVDGAKLPSCGVSYAVTASATW
jgi:hypothetical protein